MSARYFFGAMCALGAVLSILLYIASWFGHVSFGGAIWPYFLGHALVFAGSAASSSFMKPHYKVDRALQIHKLRPFLTVSEYRSVWAVFGFTMLALAVGFSQVAASPLAGILQIFAAGWFGFLYTDSMILLRAKFPVDDVRQAADV